MNVPIVKTVGADTYDYYYNRQWQVIEVRKNGDIDPEKKYFYHPYYVDAVAVRYYDENTGGAIGDIVNHYYLQDANFNVTAVTDNTGEVVERYAYTPYGEVSVLDPSFNTRASSLIANELFFTGRRRDPETGLQLNRNRFYASHLGRWVNRDPIDYEGSPGNLYQLAMSEPLTSTDPMGLKVIDWVPILSTFNHCLSTPAGASPDDYDCEKCNQPAKDWEDIPEAAMLNCERCIGDQGAGFVAGWTGVSVGSDGLRAVGGVVAVGAGKAAGKGFPGACTGGALLIDAAIDFLCVVDGIGDIRDAALEAVKSCCKPPPKKKRRGGGR